MKKVFLTVVVLFVIGVVQGQQISLVAPGVWKITFGTPGKYLPSEFKQPALAGVMRGLGSADTPLAIKNVQFARNAAGVLASLPVKDDERFYGFGLQVNSFEQRHMRRDIRVNSWVQGNVGFSHASMPFYISSAGYGVLVNTSRYVSFYMASQRRLDGRAGVVDPAGEVNIEVPGASGVELYVFAGPTMMKVMQRYNLFSGGGALPPLWGLGFKYRGKGNFTQDQILSEAKYFRESHIPCDMVGLEPGWQSKSYSCSYVWNKSNFPQPDSLIKRMTDSGFKLNLWEHAYVNPASPFFKDIVPYSGNYAVWNGAVPDFTLPEARRIFAGYHEENFVAKNIASFKLDECDGANYGEADKEWSFPDIAQFPGGMDGIEMRQVFGLLYQNTMLDIYKKENKRTMFEARASYLFASPNNAALYTDMYSHADFVRMIANSGFAGVNWSPELRETSSDADLIRRMQTMLMSAHMNANCWYLNMPPWLQYDRKKNERLEKLSNYVELEDRARKLIRLRMSLIPYLYTAFAKYRFEGVPPFRALVLDYPADKNVWKIDDEYMMGASVLCAPFIDGVSTREIYFPEGEWYDFNTNKKYAGGRKYTVTMSLDEVPMFVKAGTILPLARPLEYITPSTVFDITCRVYVGGPGAGAAGSTGAGVPDGVASSTGAGPIVSELFEDDSYTNDFEKGNYNRVELTWDGKKGKVVRKGNYGKKIYSIAADWVVAGEGAGAKNKHVPWHPYAENLETGLAWPAGQALPQFATPADTLDGFDIAKNKLASTEKLLFAALQGLVNAYKPRIFLYDVEREGKNKWPELLHLPIREYTADRKWELIGKYKSSIAGVVLYDTVRSKHYMNLATTVAGLRHALPVTRGEYAGLSAHGIDLPVLEDLTGLEYTTAAEIYSYLYDKYWKDCTKRVLVSLNTRITVNIRDIAVAAGAACLWLDPRKKEEEMVLRKYLEDMKAGESILMGWWAEERSGIGLGAQYGISTIPSDFYDNATVYAGGSHLIRLPAVSRKPKLENKIYAAVFLSDGDNVQYDQHAMSQLWDNKSRGIIPINWTVSPGIVDLGPGLLNYYYSTATPNDFMASGPSGLGYALIYDALNAKWNMTRPEFVDAYTKLSQQYLEKSGLRVITIWDEISPSQMDIYTDNCRYLYGATREDWERAPEPFQPMTKQGRLAFIPNQPCYSSDIDNIYRQWEKKIAAWDGSKPLFLCAQGVSWKMGPENIVALRDRIEKLAPGRIVICRGDHFFSLYNEASGLDYNLCLSPEMRVTSSGTTTRAELAADGSPSAGHIWVSGGGKQWIRFDFGKLCLLDRYVVRNAGAGGMDPALNTRTAELEVSVDGVRWQQADHFEDNMDDVVDIDIAPVKARYVRLRITHPGKDGVARIGDVELYGR